MEKKQKIKKKNYSKKTTQYGNEKTEELFSQKNQNKEKNKKQILNQQNPNFLINFSNN